MYVVQNFELLRHASPLGVSDWCYVSHVCRHSLMMCMVMVTLSLYMEAVITLLLFTIG